MTEEDREDFEAAKEISVEISKAIGRCIDRSSDGLSPCTILTGLMYAYNQAAVFVSDDLEGRQDALNSLARMLPEMAEQIEDIAVLISSKQGMMQ